MSASSIYLTTNFAVLLVVILSLEPVIILSEADPEEFFQRLAPCGSASGIRIIA
jgi:hypothetical protein